MNYLINKLIITDNADHITCMGRKKEYQHAPLAAGAQLQILSMQESLDDEGNLDINDMDDNDAGVVLESISAGLVGITDIVRATPFAFP
jgi:hypothetical protein